MTRRRASGLAIGFAVSTVFAGFSIPALAGKVPTQTVSAELTLSEVDLPEPQICNGGACQTVSPPSLTIEACFGDECHTVPGGVGSLKLGLVYGVVSTGHLPDLEVLTGTPPACESKRAGQTIRNPGISLSASRAKFAEGAYIEVRQGEDTIAKLPKGGVIKASTDSLSAKVCLIRS